MQRIALCTLLLRLAPLLLGTAHGVRVSLRCHRAGTLRRWEADRGPGKPRLCKAGIRGTLDLPLEPAGRGGAGSGPASRRGRDGRAGERAGRASFLVAGTSVFRCGCPLRVDLLPRFVPRGRRLAEVRLNLSSFGFWGVGLQAARGLSRPWCGARSLRSSGFTEPSGRTKMGSGEVPAVGSQEYLLSETAPFSNIMFASR